jgi:hypothetical protein
MGASRKVLLFSHACFERHWDMLPAACRKWADLALGVAEGHSAIDALVQVEDDAEEALYDACQKTDYIGQSNLASLIDIFRVAWENNEGIEEGDNAIWKADRDVQANMVRDIFGNAFRPVVIDPVWLTWRDATVLKIAQTIYDERRFADMPVLADALEEAGCTNDDILNHCRQPGEHVRGCWVVDLLLGKT